MGRRPASVAEVAERINGGETSSSAIGEFLDEYYASVLAVRMGMLSDIPPPIRLKDKRLSEVTDAYLSAVAEGLTYRDGFGAPGWTRQPCRFLDKPWFASDIQGLWPLLLMESPVFFRRRQLFVSGNVLSRA